MRHGVGSLLALKNLRHVPNLAIISNRMGGIPRAIAESFEDGFLLLHAPHLLKY